MIFGDLGGLKSFPTFVLQVRKNPEKTSPDRGSNSGPLRDRRACYCLAHSSGQHSRSLAPVWNDLWVWWPVISRDSWGLSFPHFRLTVEEKRRKNLKQVNCPDRGSNPGPLDEWQRSYPSTSAGPFYWRYAWFRDGPLSWETISWDGVLRLPIRRTVCDRYMVNLESPHLQLKE